MWRTGVLLALVFMLQARHKRETQKSDDITGCEAYRADFDMYAVCKKRGLPTRQSSRSGFAFRPIDQDLARAPLPAGCRDAAGQPVWQGAPEVIEWVYCDNLNSGCEHYLFVQKFTTLDDLRLKDNLTADDKTRAFVQACRQQTFGGAHELAYNGTYPLDADQFLDVLFGTQAVVRPRDAFGFDGMRRQALALAPAPPFKLESFFFDTSLQATVRTLNAIIRELEDFRKTVLAAPDQAEKRDLLFVRRFGEEHAKGVLRENKPSNVSAADALKKAIATYPSGDPQRERFEDVERRLRTALRNFDAEVNAAVKSLSRPQPMELVYQPGEVLFLFFKGTGSTAPRLRMTLTIKHLEPSGVSDVGVLTRAFDDVPETNRQKNILFAVDYQQYWVAYFTQPFMVATATIAPGVPKGVAQNRVLVGDAPGEYVASIELVDETTKSRATTGFRFSVAGALSTSGSTKSR
jgi:hypothetical protein